LLSVDFYPVWASRMNSKMSASGKGDVPIPKNLATVLANKYWLNSFDAFLKTQFAVENLLFYQEATKFRETDFSSTEMMELDAQRLFLRFIAPSSSEQINTSGEISHELCRVLFHKELEVVMKEQQTKNEQRQAILDDLVKVKTPSRSERRKSQSFKGSQIRASGSFGSDQELEQMASLGEEEPITPRRAGLFRSISHFSLHWKRSSDSDSNSSKAAPSNPRPSPKSTEPDSGGSSPVNQKGALKNTHSFSSMNLVQFQQQYPQQRLDGTATAGSAIISAKVHRTRSASMGLNFMGNDPNAASRRVFRRADLSTNDTVSSVSVSQTASGTLPSSGQSEAPPSARHHHTHHHHSSSSVSSRKTGSPLVASSTTNCDPSPVDLNPSSKKVLNPSPVDPSKRTLNPSPSPPLSSRKHSSPKVGSPVHTPSSQQILSQLQAHSGLSCSSHHHSSHKGGGSSKTGAAAAATESESTTPQLQSAMSPPVLPEPLALRETPILTSTPHKKHSKSRTTPRGTANASPATSEIPPGSTPKNSQAKSGRKQSKKGHSKRGKDREGEKDGVGSSFRRSGSTHSLDDSVSTSSRGSGEGDRNSFRFLDEFEENTPNAKAAATPRSFRNYASGPRRGSYDSNEARKPSLSFSSSEVSDALLSVGSCTSGDSTPMASLPRPDPTP